MRKYSELVNRQFKVNKKRTRYTLLGIILGIALYTSIIYLRCFLQDINTEYIKQNNGNYELIITQLDDDQISKLDGNVLIENISFIGVEKTLSIQQENISKPLTIYSIDSFSLTNVLNENLQLAKGTYPKADDEILLTEQTANYLNAQLNQQIVLDDKSYELVGIVNNTQGDNYLAVNSELFAIVEFSQEKNYEYLYSFITTKFKHNKQTQLMQIINDINIPPTQNVLFNSELLEQYEYLTNYNIGDEVQVLLDVSCLLIVMIALGLIYGSINVGLEEKIKSFTLLRALGATLDKIRYLLIKESFLLGLISIVPGLTVGHVISWIIIELFFKRILEFHLYNLSFMIYGKVIIIAILLLAVTIFISAIFPVMGAQRRSMMDLIGQDDRNLSLKKVKFIKKLFGYPGFLAYKRLKSNRKQFILLTSLMSSLLIFFSMYTGAHTAMIKSMHNDEFRKRDFNIEFYELITQIDKLEFRREEIENMIEELQLAESVNSNLKLTVTPHFIDVQPSPLVQDSVYRLQDNPTMIGSNLSFMFIYDDQDFEVIQTYVTGDSVSLERFQNDGLILININTMTATLNRTSELPLKVNLNDELKIKFGEVSIPFDFLGSIDTKYLVNGQLYDRERRIHFIISETTWDKYKQQLIPQILSSTSSVELGISFDFKENPPNNEDLLNLKLKISELGGWAENLYEQRAIEEKEVSGVAGLIYMIIFMTLCIGSINLLNMKDMALLFRKSEIATLLAIGMNKNKLYKMLILESMMQWMIASLIGGGISIVMLKGITIYYAYMGEENIKIEVMPIILIGIFGLFIMTLISSILPLRRFKLENTIELIRNEE